MSTTTDRQADVTEAPRRKSKNRAATLDRAYKMRKELRAKAKTLPNGI